MSLEKSRRCTSRRRVGSPFSTLGRTPRLATPRTVSDPRRARTVYTPLGGSCSFSSARFAVGKPRRRPSCCPATTVPSTVDGRPSRRAACPKSPAATASRNPVLRAATPSTWTGGTACTVNPSDRNRATVPRARWPKAQSSPTVIDPSGRQARPSSAAKSSASVRANASSKGSTSVYSTPSRSKTSSLCRMDVSIRGARSGRKTRAGCGSKVTTTDEPPGWPSAVRMTAW